MILDHVPQCAGFLVVTAAALHANGFRAGDLNCADVAPVPQGFKDTVAKAKGQNILYSLFAEVMIDAIHLLLGKDVMNSGIQFARAGAIVPKGLFNNDQAPYFLVLWTRA